MIYASIAVMIGAVIADSEMWLKADSCDMIFVIGIVMFVIGYEQRNSEG